MKIPHALARLLIVAVGFAGPVVFGADPDPAEQQTECQAMDNPFMRMECYTRLAVTEGNPRICYDLDDALSGRQSCIIEVALSKKSAPVCRRLSGDHARTLCYRRVGDLTGDYSACNTLESPGFRNACRPKGLKKTAP